MRALPTTLSIGRRLAAAFGTLCLLLGVVAAAGLFGASQESDARTQTAEINAVRDDVVELRYLDADVSGWQGYIVAEAALDGAAQATAADNSNLAGLASRTATYELLDALDAADLTAPERVVVDERVAELAASSSRAAGTSRARGDRLDHRRGGRRLRHVGGRGRPDGVVRLGGRKARRRAAGARGSFHALNGPLPAPPAPPGGAVGGDG